MKIIGITGGVGSGKSEVLNILEEQFGTVCVRLDEVSKALMKKGGPCYAPVLDLFGSGVVLPDGEFDRGAIAAKIFSDDSLRLAMNQIMHPAVKQAVLADIAARRAKETEEMAAPRGTHTEVLYVLESALLLEEKYNEICTEVWYVYADEAVRRLRLAETRGYSEEKITSIMKSQQSDECFRAHADRILENSGDLADTARQIREALKSISEAAEVS